MSIPRTLLSLACLAWLAMSGVASAQFSIQQVQYRPRLLERGSRLFGGRDTTRRGDDRRWPSEEPAEPSRPVMTEPVKLPPYRPAGSAVPQPRVLALNPEVEEAQLDPLLQLVHRAISVTSQRQLDVNQHMPWQIMHAVLALRGDLYLRSGDQYVRAIDWISSDPVFRNQHWFEATKQGGRAHPFNVPYHFEGHVNQFLALLAMSNLPLDHEFKVGGGKTVTMADMVNNAKMTVNSREEISWTLWFLTHYIDQESEWVNERGEHWSMEELVRIQTQDPVHDAPCGGTHGLFALAYARNSYLHHHGRLRGAWFEADQKVKRHVEIARSLQNGDGSFSTEKFSGPGFSRDYNERIAASGHMLEWLMMALPQNRLSENWVRRGVASVASDLIHHSGQMGECGPVAHAMHALVLYADRVTPKGQTNIAHKESGRRERRSKTSQPEISSQSSPSPSSPAEQPMVVTQPKGSTPEQDTSPKPQGTSRSAGARPFAEPSETASPPQPPQVVSRPEDKHPESPATRLLTPDSKHDPTARAEMEPVPTPIELDEEPLTPPAQRVAENTPQSPNRVPQPSSTDGQRSRMTRWAAERAARIARRYARRGRGKLAPQPLRGPALPDTGIPTSIATESDDAARRR